MRVRVVLFVVCLGLSTWSASTLFASRHSDDLCCGSTEDCNGNGKCCDPESIGRPPCSLERPGICLDKCVPLGGGG
jgi:hypothetical protein